MLRLISCQQATLFVEKRTDAALPFGDRSSLWLHLGYCPMCRRYARQSELLNRLALAAAKRAVPPRLSEAARERLRRSLP